MFRKKNNKTDNNASLFTTLLLSTLAPLVAISLLLVSLAIYLLVVHERSAVLDRLNIVTAAMASEAKTYLAFDQPGYFPEKAQFYIGSGKAHGIRLFDVNHTLVAQVGEINEQAIVALSPVLDAPDQLLMQPEALVELALPPSALPDDYFQTIGYVEASYSLESYLQRILLVSISTAAILLLSIVVVIAYAYRKTNIRLLEPIRCCQNYMKQLTAGEYSATLPIESNIAEIQSLANSAKVLSKQLDKNDKLQLERIQEQATHASELSRALKMADERRQHDMESVSRIVNNTIKALDEIQSYSSAIAGKSRDAELRALSRGLSASINAATYTVQDGINFFGESNLTIDSIPRVITTAQLLESIQAGFNGSRLDLDCNINFQIEYESLCQKTFTAIDHHRLLQLLSYFTQNMVQHTLNKKLDVYVKNLSADPNTLVMQIILACQSVYEREQVYNTHKFFNGEFVGDESPSKQQLMFAPNQARIISQLTASLEIDINCLFFVNERVAVSLDLSMPVDDDPAQLDSLTVRNHLSIVVISNEHFNIEYSHQLRRQGIVLEQYTLSTFKLDDRIKSLTNPVFFIDATIPAEASHFAKDIYRVIPKAKVVGMILRHQDYEESTLDLIDHNLEGLITIPIATPDLVAKAQQVVEIFDKDQINAILQRVTSGEE